jgi:hypothetical protein
MKTVTGRADEVTVWSSTRMMSAAQKILSQNGSHDGQGAGARHTRGAIQDGRSTARETKTDMTRESEGTEITIATGIGILAESEIGRAEGIPIDQAGGREIDENVLPARLEGSGERLQLYE